MTRDEKFEEAKKVAKEKFGKDLFYVENEKEEKISRQLVGIFTSNPVRMIGIIDLNMYRGRICICTDREYRKELKEIFPVLIKCLCGDIYYSTVM